MFTPSVMEIPPVPNQPKTFKFHSVALARQILWKEAFRLCGFKQYMAALWWKQMTSRSVTHAQTSNASDLFGNCDSRYYTFGYSSNKYHQWENIFSFAQSENLFEEYYDSDENEQSDNLTCTHRKNRRSRLESNHKRVHCKKWTTELTLLPPPNETHRGVEIVIDILVVVGGGGSRKRMW